MVTFLTKINLLLNWTSTFNFPAMDFFSAQRMGPALLKSGRAACAFLSVEKKKSGIGNSGP